MNAIARPPVVAAQRFHHDERPAEFRGQEGGMLQAEVRSAAARARHPVQDERPLGMNRPVVEGTDTRGGNSGDERHELGRWEDSSRAGRRTSCPRWYSAVASAEA